MSASKINFNTAVAIVVANMIGTGVFTSLGFQVLDIQSAFAIILLWVLGGIMALCGALVYGEIGSVYTQSGGEYNYLSKLYHPVVGFLSGWVSSTVGFAAPVALASMALGHYVTGVFPNVQPTVVALFVVVLITVIHATNIKTGAAFQRYATYIKIVFIVLFIIGGFILAKPVPDISFLPNGHTFTDIFGSAAFAVSLFWVSYSYSGWNAAAYISGEIENPQKNVPKSLLIGTLIVSVLYVLLNALFLYSTPTTDLKGQIEIGHISATHIFGTNAGKTMSLIISLLLVSSISAMILAGPRVVASIGNDVQALRLFTKKNKNEVPYVAVLFQSFVSIVLILTAKFNEVLELIGFTLTLFTTLTVFGIFILRKKQRVANETTYKTWGYPITPILFLLINGWILYYGFSSKMQMALLGLALVLAGLPVYFIGKKKQ
ncbi:MAG: amino acid permease [Bacteroidetes bacterium]|nr:amino acid permease [Bacteroidota bacterium]